MLLFCMGRTSAVVILVLLPIVDSLERCISHSGENVISRVCDSCCGFGRNKMCCSDKMTRHISATSVMIGCITGFATIGLACAGLYVTCVLPRKHRVRTDSCPASPTENHSARSSCGPIEASRFPPAGSWQNPSFSSWV
ncbi:uncharacterized protein [Haliotis asinina]|uniref:uncharacterized protein n=1 Tax=Haliotis asinina TaxID=109174 RepID=UPI003532456D